MKVKIYFSKSSHLPCVEFGETFETLDNMVKAEDLLCCPKIEGKWFEGSPSWALTCEAESVEVKDKTIIIR